MNTTLEIPDSHHIKLVYVLIHLDKVLVILRIMLKILRQKNHSF